WLSCGSGRPPADWQRFLQVLLRQMPRKIHAVLANRLLRDPSILGDWLATQHSLTPVFLPPDTPPATGAHPGRPGLLNVPLDITTRPNMPLTHLQRLEAESIHIMREVVAEAENPVMLYSIGKDSAVMLHLAMKAFYPAVPPFPLLHVDTRWKFRDM